MIDDLIEAGRCHCLGALAHEAFTAFAGHEQLGLDRDLAKKGYGHLSAHLIGPTCHRGENLTLVAAIRADEATHVLDDAEHARSRLLTKVDLLAHIRESYFLRSCHDDGAEHVSLCQILDHGNVLIRSPRWCVND